MVITNLVLNKDVGSLMKRFMVVMFQKIPIIWVILFVVWSMGNSHWWEGIHTTLGQGRHIIGDSRYLLVMCIIL